jgi:hypothetical protein
MAAVHESISFLVSFLVEIEEKLLRFMPRFVPGFESRARVELPAAVRANISFP